MKAAIARITGQGAVADYAASLLERLGWPSERCDGAAGPRPSDLWARSGAMALTGHADRPPLLAPGPLAACAEGALAALRALAPRATLPVDGAALLGEHAAWRGSTRRGRTSPGGRCRLLRAGDGWVALHLARDSDRESLPALLECTPSDGDRADPWAFAERHLPQRSCREWVERGRWLSLPLAHAAPPAPLQRSWLVETRRGDPALPPRRAPRVVDLSSLWAGPLCTSLLRGLGAEVVKLESVARPDGLRRGSPGFFDLLNAGKSSVALDLDHREGRRQLVRLLSSADLVVEGTRPRALAQLGIDATDWLRARSGRVWLSITGYGRDDAAPGRVAFGDDAAAAAGLAWATGEALGGPVFCGDAIADPLTGLHAALAAAVAWCQGGARLLDVSLRDVAAHTLAFPAELEGPSVPVRAPRTRKPCAHARPFGADTLAELARRAC